MLIDKNQTDNQLFRSMTNDQLDRMLEKGADGDIRNLVKKEIDRRFKNKLKRQDRLKGQNAR